MNKEKVFDRMAVQRPLVYVITIFLYFFGALSLADDLMRLTFSTAELTLLPVLIGKFVSSLLFALFMFLFARRNVSRASAGRYGSDRGLERL
jgi:polyferredoxin